MLWGLLVLPVLVLLVVGGYLLYLLLDYDRIADNRELAVTRNRSDILEPGAVQRIVSWNLGFGAYSSDYSFFMDGGRESRGKSRQAVLHNVSAAIDTLQSLAPDFMLLQEVDTHATRSYHINQREMLEQAFAESHAGVYAQNYHSSYLFYPLWKPHGASQSGILTLSDVSISGAVRRKLPIESGVRKFFDLDRCYCIHRIPVEGGGMLCLINLHLSAYTSDGSIATRQIELLLQEMVRERRKGSYVIAGGDFNKDVWGNSAAVTGISGKNAAWAQPFPKDCLPEGFTLVNSLDRENPVLSCRDTGAPYVKGATFEVTLDGFIISDNVEVRSCRVVNAGFAASDHNPVEMCFVLKEARICTHGRERMVEECRGVAKNLPLRNAI